jgi:serine/threonine-protein kinase
VNGPHVEFDPMFSPDGRWLAYSSIESGHPEVYVRPFPGPGGRWLIGAGANPTWSRVKNELFYGVDGQIMVNAYAVEGRAFRAGRPERWLAGRYQTRGSRRMFDLHPDGKRFALAPSPQVPNPARQDKIMIASNFFDELRRVTFAARQ